MNWISVKDRLPNSTAYYLVYDEGRKLEDTNFLVMHYESHDNFGWSYYADHITHWMPLPNPPMSDAHLSKCVPRITDGWNKPSELIGYICADGCPQSIIKDPA